MDGFKGNKSSDLNRLNREQMKMMGKNVGNWGMRKSMCSSNQKGDCCGPTADLKEEKS